MTQDAARKALADKIEAVSQVGAYIMETREAGMIVAALRAVSREAVAWRWKTQPGGDQWFVRDYAPDPEFVAFHSLEPLYALSPPASGNAMREALEKSRNAIRSVYHDIDNPAMPACLAAAWETADIVLSAFTAEDGKIPDGIRIELDSCRHAVAAIEANRHPESETQNHNLSFYQGKVAGLEFALAAAPLPRNGRPAFWTHDDEAAKDVGHLYYFAPTARAAPPYKTQRHVTAIIDIAADGTLAGVELIENMPPPPDRTLSPQQRGES